MRATLRARRSALWRAAWRQVRRRTLPLVDFAPRSMLRVHESRVERARYPAIDIHNHLRGPHAGRWADRSLESLPALLDGVNVTLVVNLDGGAGDLLDAELRRAREAAGRVIVFAGLDYDGLSTADDFGVREAARLRDAVARGARGLKVWKTLGLEARDPAGALIPIDDERLGPLWAEAGELGVPVLIHVADPPAFFQPWNRRNERWEELADFPEWHRYPVRRRGDVTDGRAPGHDELIEQFAGVLRRHPDTVFVAAHLASLGDDLERLASLLDAHPNLWVDTGARIGDLGRQPYTARAFLEAFADRVVFGSDQPPDPAAYRLWFRFFETRDEYFSYWPHGGYYGGRWMIYGVDLSDAALRKIYSDNARRLLRLEGPA